MTAERIRQLAEAAVFTPPLDDHLVEVSNFYTYPTGAPYYAFLYYLQRELRAQRVLELGVQTGRSMTFLCAACPDITVWGVDRDPVDDPEMSNCTTYYLKGMTNWKFWIGDSCEFVNHLPWPEVDLLHIDTEHSYEQLIKEWAVWRPKMASGGIICLDDTCNEHMLTALSEVLDPERDEWIDLAELHPQQGYSVVICK